MQVFGKWKFSNYIMLKLEYGRKQVILQMNNSLLRFPEELLSALESTGHCCEQRNILLQSSNAGKSSDITLLQSVAQIGENLEGLKSAH